MIRIPVPRVALAEVCELITDGTHFSPPNTSEGQFLYITSKNIRPGRMELHDVTFVTKEVHDEIYGRCPVRYGDVLFVKDGVNTGTAAINIVREPFSMLSSVALLRPREPRLDARFLMHWLNSPDGQDSMIRNMSGSAIRRLVLREIRMSKLPLAPLAEQRRIAAILDQAEALRAKRRHALAQLDTLTQSLFLDLFGDPKANQQCWPEVAMATLFAAPPVFGTMIPPTVDGGEWLSLRVANIQDWQLDLSDEKHVSLPPNTVERHSVREGDLLMARAIASQEHLGKSVVVYPRGRKWAFDSHLMRLRFNLAKTEPEFIRHLLMTVGGRQLFLKASRRSVVQYNINTKEISALRIPIPPLSLQHEFAAQVVAVERLKAAQRVSLEKLDALFASLQHRAFRGEL